jgi:hypothetical protein
VGRGSVDDNIIVYRSQLTVTGTVQLWKPTVSQALDPTSQVARVVALRSTTMAAVAGTIGVLCRHSTVFDYSRAYCCL